MKQYQKDNLIVYWDPDKCVHAAACVRCLPKVFNPRIKPWVNLENADIKEIMETIDKCPSKALCYEVV